MELTKKTILITGGGSGIGLETAKLLNTRGNTVLIIGRNGEKLDAAAKALKNVTTFVTDITDAESVKRLVAKIAAQYEDLSIVINNAASAYVYTHSDSSNSFQKASEEMLTNYLSVIRLNELLLPILKRQAASIIVNTTAMVAFAPLMRIPTYSATKAALHSYTLSLRLTLSKSTSVKVVELMPPLVNTEFSKAIGGEENGIPPVTVAQALIDGIENNNDEIHVGQTKDFRDFYFSNPEEAFLTLNQG